MKVGELPAQIRQRWVSELGLTPKTAATLTSHPAYARFFEATCRLFQQPVKVANWMQTEVLRGAKLRGLEARFTVRPEQVAELLELVEEGEISGKQAKEVLGILEGSELSPRAVAKERGLRVVSSAGDLEPLCRKLIERYPDQAAAYRAGKQNLLGFFVGQVMKETGGAADPKLVSSLLVKLLKQG
jgi:aspartyl-tRNA(Asn)/glutamyl-tRNA(Gln) amidotransferase subunit B